MLYEVITGIRFEISPTVAAASCLLILLSCLFLTIYSLPKRSVSP